MTVGRASAFIVTLKRAADSAPEVYYVTGTDAKHATSRALRMAKAKLDQVVEIISG